VKATERLSNSPAIVVDHESGAVRKMLSYLDANRVSSLPKQKLEVNPRHPTVVRVFFLFFFCELVSLPFGVLDALITCSFSNPRCLLDALDDLEE